MKKLLSAALMLYVAALLVSWSVGLIRQALPVIVPCGIVAVGIIVYLRIKKYNDSNKY